MATASFLTAAAGEIYANNYTIGQHQSVAIYDAITHAKIDIGADVTSFEFNEVYDELNPKTISGKPKPRSLPEMVVGKFVLLRYTGTLAQLFSDMRKAYYSNGTSGFFNIEQTIAPPGIATQVIRILGASLRFTMPGTYARDAAVEMTVDFNASDWEAI